MKKIFKVVFPLSVITLVIGCSKSNSPVSVSEENSLTSAELVGDSPFSLDIATANTSIIWVLSDYAVQGQSDRYLYKYNSGTNTWANTGHWGKAHTVSPSGKNYHINTNQEIWWGDGNGNFGQISTSGQGISEVRDITVSRIYSNHDNVWVLCKTNSDSILVKEFNLNPNDNSVTWLSDPVMPSQSGYSIWKIVRDPNTSSAAVVLIANNETSHKYLYARIDSADPWSEQNITYNGIIDVAICETKVVYTCATTNGARLVRGTVDGIYDNVGQGIDNSLSCAMNRIGAGFYNVYILTGNYNKVDRISY